MSRAIPSALLVASIPTPDGNPLTRLDIPGLAYTTINESDSGFNTVVCSGTGTVTIILEDPNNEPCLGDCLRVHEDYHRRDILSQNPQICKGKKFRQAIMNPVASQLVTAETRAYGFELDCLLRKLRQPTCDTKCQAVVQERIDFIRGTILPSLQRGQLPK